MKKAGSRCRSTTSSTTGRTATGPARPKAEPARELTSDSPEPESISEPTVFTRRQQLAFLKALQKMASPLAACVQLNLLLDSYDLTREQDAAFRRKVDRLFEAFNENVDAAIYRDAMEGSASSQAIQVRLRSTTADVDVDLAARAKELSEMSTEDLLACQDQLRRLGGTSNE